MSMNFGMGANIKLGSSQKLTPQMQQAIRLLQMSSIELEQEVQRQLDDNPMLEREQASEDLLDNLDSNFSDNNFNDDSLNASLNHDDIDGGADAYQADNLNDENSYDGYDNSDNDQDGFNTSNTSVASGYDDADLSKQNDEPANSYDKLAESSISSINDVPVDTDWSNIYTHGATAAARPDTSDLDSYQGNTSASIQDHVRWQLNFKHLSQIDTLIADHLVDAMAESGIIDIDFEELQQNLTNLASFNGWADEVEQDEIVAVLHMIQSCDPVGVGATDLSECLRLQLAKLAEDTPHLSHAEQLLNHSQYLLSNNIDALIKETELSLKDIEPALTLIRTLNPAPGRAYTNEQEDYGLTPENYDVPDVLVVMLHDDAINNKNADTETDAKTNVETNAEPAQPTWHVSLNPETLPKLRINQEYASLVKRGVDTPDNNYLRDNLNDARLFIRSIQERNQNLLKVATSIVKRQEQFLLKGAVAMKPLVLKDVAEEVELHESTVSRLTTSKSMLTPQGLFSLKYFFSSSVSGNNGEVSSTAICAMIEQMIAHEDAKKPLSDSAIVEKLAEQGIKVARRTVAKYREQLHIGSSSQRKQKY